MRKNKHSVLGALVLLGVALLSTTGMPKMANAAMAKTSWIKASYYPSEGLYGTSFIFQYPTTLVGQNTDKLSSASSTDVISKEMTTKQAVVFDTVVALSSGGIKSFEQYVKDAAARGKGAKISSFKTKSGLKGKRILTKDDFFGDPLKRDIILLHTGKKSDMGYEIVIKIDGTYGFKSKSGKFGIYTGSTSGVIEQIAKTVSL